MLDKPLQAYDIIDPIVSAEDAIRIKNLVMLVEKELIPIRKDSSLDSADGSFLSALISRTFLFDLRRCETLEEFNTVFNEKKEWYMNAINSIRSTVLSELKLGEIKNVD